jgi:hypothetical protein
MPRADDDGVESVHLAFFNSADLPPDAYIQRVAAQGYVRCTSRAMPELSQNRLPTSIGHSQRLLAPAYFWAMVGTHSRPTFGDMGMREETFEERWR